MSDQSSARRRKGAGVGVGGPRSAVVGVVPAPRFTSSPARRGMVRAWAGAESAFDLAKALKRAILDRHRAAGRP